MLIRGTILRLRRTPAPAPKDGVHRSNALGYISGAKAHIIDERICPHGMTSFMFGTTKVFYGLKTQTAASEHSVRRSQINQIDLAVEGLALTAGGMVEIRLELDGCYGKIRSNCLGFITDVVPITNKLVEYFKGNPYQWDGPDNPKAFLSFADAAEKVIRERVPRLATRQYLKDMRKIGNILWHEKHHRYYIVDCG